MTSPFALVVEDDPGLGAIFIKTLERSGFETVLDTDGNLYPRILSTKKPSLVVVDFHLPFATGDQIISDIRAQYPDDDVLIIVVTADLYKGKELQAKGEFVLTKPVSPMRLADIIAQKFKPATP